ncbi:hypothetical protein [Streptomyces sp. SID1328]|uniref:hypothetical protein n=1 Tax=Streptomyces sp. SID1328 TaxID=2690250 RepID=UPI001928C9CE|nr:hypothetical protein [Streptomyces sp. SID1328]
MGTYLYSATEDLTSINHAFTVTNRSAIENTMFALMNVFEVLPKPTPGIEGVRPSAAERRIAASRIRPSRILGHRARAPSSEAFRGWHVAHLPGEHFHQIIDPAGTAGHLVELATTA